MAAPAKVTTLPEEIRRELEGKLISNGFGGYDSLAQWLENQGFEISRSSVHRYGSELKRRLSAIKASTEAARMIVEAAPDDQDTRSGAVISLVQSDLFEALLALQEGQEEESSADRVKLLSTAARAIADVSRASQSQKKFMHEVRQKAEAAATAVEQIAKRGGMSDEAGESMRRIILGVAT